MKRFHAGKKSLAFAMILAVSAVGLGWHAIGASASTDAPVSNVSLSAVTLRANSSYVTDAYAGVQHLNVADSSVAYASEDSMGRIVVTGIANGKTTVSFWYKSAASSDWISAAMPVTVSGVADTSAAVNASNAGIVFSESTVTVSAGTSYTPVGIKVDGTPVDTSDLLWVSGSDSAVSVDKQTGKITAVAAGTATVYAVDPETKACAALTVNVPAA